MTPAYDRIVDLTISDVRAIHSDQNHEPPFDLRAACETLDIWYREEELSQHIDAFRFRTSNGVDYVIANRLVYIPVARRRFSVAHEIGHVTLNRLVDGGQVSIDTRPSDIQRIEWICNHYAGCLLMPGRMFSDLWHEYSAKKYGRIAIIASRFEVSVAAVKTRAVHLGLAASIDLTYR